MDLGDENPFTNDKLNVNPAAEIPGLVDWVPDLGLTLTPSQWVADGAPTSPDIATYVTANGEYVAGAWVEYDLTGASSTSPVADQPFKKELQYVIDDPGSLPDRVMLDVFLTDGTSASAFAAIQKNDGEWAFSAGIDSAGAEPNQHVALDINDYAKGEIVIDKPAGETGNMTMTLTSMTDLAAPVLTLTVPYSFQFDAAMYDPFRVSVPVPEPTTVGLLGLGLLALRARRRTKARRRQ